MNTTAIPAPANDGDAQRLPLWRECARQMIADGLEYGKTYPASYFAQWLKVEPDTMAFTLAVSEIRRALEHKGVYLCGRGQKGEQYVLLAPEAHARVMQSYARRATDALKRGVILGTNTRLDSLSTEDRRRHEAVLEKMATKFALISRSQQVMRALPKAASLRLLEKSA